MNANTIQLLSPADVSPAGGNPADGKSDDGTAERSSAERVVLSGLAVALLATPVLPILGTNWQVVQLLWIFAAVWVIVVSFVDALRQGIRHGDWSAFVCGEIPSNDDDLDYTTKTGLYAHLRIRARHEALMREGDRGLRDRNTFNPQ